MTVHAYILRDIDPKVWAAVKARAKSEGREIKFVFHEILKEYARVGYQVLITDLREQQAEANKAAAKAAK